MNFPALTHPILLIALLAIAPGVSAEEADHFRAGVDAYEAGNYEAAARSFGESLKAQTAAGTLLNLGLAEWRCGRAGEAILAWERASWLDPFNCDTRGNLTYARESAAVNPPGLTWFEEASTWLPANWWTWLAGGSLWLAVALVTVPGFLRWRKAGWHQTVAAFSLGVFLLTLAPSAGILTRSKIGLVMEKNTLLRLTPTQAGEVVASLPPGEPVRELRRRGEYLLVRTESGSGWLERRQVQFICPW